MFKRTLLVGLFIVLTFVPAAGQDNTPQILLIATHHWDTLETTISTLDVDTGNVEALFTVDDPLLGIGRSNTSLSPTGDWMTYFTVPDTIPVLNSPFKATYYVRDVFGDEFREIGTYDIQVDPRGNLPHWQLIMPSWSPDGRRFTFVNWTPPYSWEIVVVDASTGASHTIPVDSTMNTPPQWSPDSTTLAYYAPYCQYCAVGMVYLVSALEKDATPRPLFSTEPDTQVSVWLEGWIADSRELVVSRTDHYYVTPSYLMTVNADTGEAEKIPEYNVWGDSNQSRFLITGDGDFPALEAAMARSNGSFEVSLDWSRIAIPERLDERSIAVRIFDLTTGEQLTQIDTDNALQALYWSPDGERLAYQTFSSPASSWVFTARADGSEEPHPVAEIDGSIRAWVRAEP